MASLCIIICFLVFLELHAWFLALSARAVGSARGRLRFGVIVVLVVDVIGLLTSDKQARYNI
jgi:hypothetical protein